MLAVWLITHATWQVVKRSSVRQVLTIAETNEYSLRTTKTFQQALQAIWTVESLFEVEENRLVCRWVVLTNMRNV